MLSKVTSVKVQTVEGRFFFLLQMFETTAAPIDSRCRKENIHQVEETSQGQGRQRSPPRKGVGKSYPLN